MATNTNRVMVSIPAEIETEIKQLKQTHFCDMSYAELYRQILRLGLDKIAEKKVKKT